MDTLGFDVFCTSSAARDSFVASWKSSSDFYLDEDPADANMASSAANEDDTPTPTNDDVAPTDDTTAANKYATSTDDTNQGTDGEKEGNVS